MPKIYIYFLEVFCMRMVFDSLALIGYVQQVVVYSLVYSSLVFLVAFTLNSVK